MGRRALKRIFMREIIAVLAIIITFIFSGCGNEPEHPEDKSTEPGRIALSIAWKTQSADSDIQNPDGTLNCENSEVAYIYAAVYDSENRFLGDSGSQGWDCSEHSGIIEGIEAGEGRKIVILAKNQNNEVVFRGEQNNVTVTAGQTVKPEPVEAYIFSPELTDPDNGATLTNGTFAFRWNPIRGDIKYRIVVSINSDFSNPVIDKTTTATDLPPEGLSTDVLYYWRVDAVDNFGNTGKSTPFSFKIEKEVNLPPVLDPIGDREVLEDETLTFILQGSDPEGRSLTFSAGNLPTGATFNPVTRQFAWTPEFHQGGKAYQNILFYVSDDIDQRDEETITIIVGDDGVNHPPQLNPIGNKSVNESSELRFTISAIDPDFNNDDNLVYEASNLPAGAVFNANTHEFRWTPGYNQAGAYQNVIFKVADENGDEPLSDFEVITITVGNVNRPPVLASIGDRGIDEDKRLTFTITANDPDGDIITYTAESNGAYALPAGWTFNASTRTFTWKPEFEDTGNYQITFTATDNGTPNLEDFEEIWISVGDVNRPPALSPVGNRSGTEDIQLRFTVTATDADGDILTFSAESDDDTGPNQPIPTGWDFNNVTKVFSWTPTYNDAGKYDLKFTVADNGIPNMDDDETIVITIANANRAPVLTPIGNQVVNEGTLLTFSISGSDLDGDTLTYSAASTGTNPLPSGWSFVGNTFNWIPGYDEAGNYDITFTVTDNSSPNLSDSETVTVSVMDVNGQPVLTSIGDKTVNEGSLLQFSISASDPDIGDSLTYSATNLPEGATFNPSTHQFRWIPDYNDTGDYDVTFTVTDNGSPIGTDAETITIRVSNVNLSPVLNLIGNQTVNEGSTLSFTATASDPDGDDYTFSLSNAPSGASINANSGEFTWTPTYGQSGTYTNVQITVTDNGSPVQNDSEQFSITVGDVNRPPVLNSIGNRTVNEGSTLSFTATASDPDGDDYTFALSNAPSGASIDPDTGAFTWTTAYGQSGIYTNVQITVTDDGSPVQNDSEQFSITVGDVNRPPVLNAIGNRTVNEGGTLSFTATASDPDGDDYTFSLSNAPTGASINPNSGAFTWTPGYGQSGTYTNVQITVTDDGSPVQNDSEQFSITVGEVNRPPVLNSIGNRTVNEGGTLSFTATASDPDGDDYTFSLSNAPTGASIDPDSGEFSWTPGYGQSGTYTNVQITVTDNGSPVQNDSEQISITVGDVNRPPVLDAIGNRTIDEGSTLNFTVTASDPDGDDYTFSLSNAPSGASIDPDTGEFTWTPLSDEAGDYVVIFTVTDDGDPSEEDSETITITVNDTL